MRTASRIQRPSMARLGLVAHLEGGNEGGLGDLHLAELAHALLALFLLLQQLSFTRDVATIALREHVLAQGLHGLAGNDPAAERRLDRDREELAGDQLLEALAERAAPPLG